MKMRYLTMHLFAIYQTSAIINLVWGYISIGFSGASSVGILRAQTAIQLLRSMGGYRSFLLCIHVQIHLKDQRQISQSTATPTD